MSVAYASRAAPARAAAAKKPIDSSPVRHSRTGGNSGTATHAMPAAVRLRLERSFGADLSGIRVHSDSAAARDLGTRAFARGADIHLAPGNRADDLRLMAHETAHVLQARQAKAPAPLRLGGEHSALEAEAQLAAEHVSAGASFSVQGRADSGAMQGWGIGNIIDRAIAFLRERARDIPGYDLLGLILGRDPITQQPVARNATNLLRALLGLVPGGAQMFANLQQARVIERAFDWVNGELDRLGLTWASIRAAIDRFLASLGASDLLNLGGVLNRARDIFAPIVRRVGTFAVAAGRRILEFIFEGALALGGGAAQRILALFRRIGATFSTIVNDPVRFLSNLINSVVGGFQRFSSNILEHLRNGLFDWLLGAMAGAGLRMPRRFDLAGILDLVLQVLGLTYARLRERLVRLIGEPAVATLEQTFEFLRTLLTQGLAAAWQQLLEFASGLVDTVLAGIRNFVLTRIVQAAVTRLATMFNPVGAVINAIIAIYNTVQFVIERARQIAAFVTSVLDSLDNIARGNIGAAIAYVERTLGRILSLAISFLASLIGLGGIAGRIREIIGRIRAVVDRALDRLTAWIGQRARGLASRALGGDPNATPAERLRRGLADAVSVVNRLPGNRLGRAVVQPVLGAIRLRHNMRSLEAVPRNGRWAVAGEVNPRGENLTEKLVETGTASGSFRSRVTYHPVNPDGFGTHMLADPVGPGHPEGTTVSESLRTHLRGRIGSRQGQYRLGHLLNHHIGGPGNDWRNLTPITPSANSTHLHHVERDVKALVRAGRWVRYEVRATYTGSAPTPSPSVHALETRFARRLRWNFQLLKPRASDPTQLENDSTAVGDIPASNSGIVDSISAGYPA